MGAHCNVRPTRVGGEAFALGAGRLDHLHFRAGRENVLNTHALGGAALQRKRNDETNVKLRALVETVLALYAKSDE